MVMRYLLFFVMAFCASVTFGEEVTLPDDTIRTELAT
jgi:hypothetical protein